MSDEHTSYHTEIADYAAKSGFVPTPEQIEAANGLLNARLTRFSTRLTMIDGDLGDITPAFAHACQWFTKAPATPPEPAPPPAPSRWTGQTAVAVQLTAAARARDTADAIANAKALASGPNPFRPGGNLTHQAIIQHHLPGVAAKLKSQA